MRKIGIGIALGAVLALSIIETKSKLMRLVNRGKTIIKNKVDEVLD